MTRDSRAHDAPDLSPAPAAVKLDGSMSVAQRDAVIGAFRSDPTITVFLISLKAGGVALNLTPASRIFLMDPWWCVTTLNAATTAPHT